jgi:hypothetical protein
VPARLLIGPGLISIGVSLLLMRGLNAGSTWTHLIPGMIVAGVGVGLVNPAGLLLVAAITAVVAGIVSLAAIRSRDFARAAPGGQEGPRK